MHTYFDSKAVKNHREPLPVIWVFNRLSAPTPIRSPAIVEGMAGQSFLTFSLVSVLSTKLTF
jgi:hypothetical protein